MVRYPRPVAGRNKRARERSASMFERGRRADGNSRNSLAAMIMANRPQRICTDMVEGDVRVRWKGCRELMEVERRRSGRRRASRDFDESDVLTVRALQPTTTSRFGQAEGS